MAAPTLVSLARTDLPGQLAGLPDQQHEFFLVAEAGEFGGRWFQPGDLLVCGGDPRGGEPVVLVPRGHGRPRLGTVQGKRLIGDAGELCHEVRWRVAGRVVSVVQDAGLVRMPRSWQRSAALAAGVDGLPRDRRNTPRPPMRAPIPSMQLTLFGAAA